MRLWEHADTCGKLHYSLIPALDIVKVKEAINVLNVSQSTNIKVQETKEQVSNQRTSSCNVDSYMDSLTRLCKASIDGYTCDRCKMKFPMVSMLNRHKISHNAGKHIKKKYVQCLKMNAKMRSGHLKTSEHLKKSKYVCTFCDFVCSKLVTLATHVKKRHKEKRTRTNLKKFKCSICSYECSSQKCLNEHMYKHKNKNTTRFICNICNFECKRSTTLTSHLAQNHKKSKKDLSTSTKKRRKITKCNNLSAKKVSLPASSDNREIKNKIPLIFVENPKLIIKEEIEDCRETSDATIIADVSKKAIRKNIEEHCNLCDFTCDKKSTLYSHKRRHKMKNISEVYSCNECGFKTSKKTSLYSHIKRKHKESHSRTGDVQIEFFYCNQCDYKNKNKYELKVHVARKHTDDFKFSCETCGKKFKVKGDLTNHIRFSHKEQPVICDVCGKTCLNSNSLYVHQKFAHYKAKYECQICKRRMVSQENLNEHMLRQHERRENVVCEECGKTFSRNSRLKVHMRIHTGDKPYTCTVCNKSFARRTALKQHLLIHTGIRPYVCDICGKSFTQKPGLISHRKSHPGSHPPLPRVLIDHILNDVMNI